MPTTSIPSLIDPRDAFCTYLERHNAWGLYISLHEIEHDTLLPEDRHFSEMQKAASFLILPWDSDGLDPRLAGQHIQAFLDHGGYFMFESQEAMQRAFDQCVGDDGPTELNPEGSQYYSCYALTFGPYKGKWQALNENT